jgi:hypothetical protein
MAHLFLTSALLFALLAIVATAIGACMGIARDLMLDGSEDDRDEEPASTRNTGISFPEEFGVGLRHAATFAPTRGGIFRDSGSRDT